ncbi:HNH endonuclease signature motif containing protein [Aerococcus urinaeequi]|uniref:HNH endonuclease signature motif containing protein n=1 Tax=Aerococcus urinaeequi TaxID=51665 RepID=UPI000845D90F|nr:HNH endonuclease signature motif containing protein [Aerococcus urinaeequi]
MARLFTDEQEKFIEENIKGVLTADLTDLVNETFGTSYTVSQVRNLKNRRRWSSGLITHFEKGHKPFNKGLKQTDYMAAEQIEKTEATRFKKNSVPPNWKEIGSTRISKNGYLQIKVSDLKGNKNYKPYHRLIYEKHHGVKIKDDEVVVFLDQNKMNFSIDNLKLVKRRELGKFNKEYAKMKHPELNEQILNLIKFELTIADKEVE